MLKVLLVIVIVSVVIVCLLLVVAMATDYKPDPVLALATNGGAMGDNLEVGREYIVTTFNIGYCGLGKDEDFFMDGGKNSGAQSKDEVLGNLENIASHIQQSDSDFVLLQEVDEKAKRSFRVNQRELFEQMEGYVSSFAINYKVFYVPIPISRPMGGVLGGIMTMSRTHPAEVKRHVFDGSEAFPVQLFELDRCFTISRFDTDNGKQLVLINAHFSAYDKGGAVRTQQLAQMKQVATDEYSKGNYVIIGGDWNNELPGTDAANFEWKGDYPDWYMKLPDDFVIDGYSWAVDPATPTCRDNRTEYKQGESFVVTLDGFLISDNISVNDVKVTDLGFEHSDHNPVNMKIILD